MPRYLSNEDEVNVSKNRVPHWQLGGASYFITYRLADSFPVHLLKEFTLERTEWISLNPKPWDQDTEREYHLRFSTKIDKWLDAGMGNCVLRNRDARSHKLEAILHFNHKRYVIHTAVIMPNHVHVLVTLKPAELLDKVVRSWKSFSARRINDLLELKGALWQVSYFDRLIRDAKHFTNCQNYIRKNPQKANLNEEEFWLYDDGTDVRPWG